MKNTVVVQTKGCYVALFCIFTAKKFQPRALLLSGIMCNVCKKFLCFFDGLFASHVTAETDGKLEPEGQEVITQNGGFYSVLTAVHTD